MHPSPFEWAIGAARGGALFPFLALDTPNSEGGPLAKGGRTAKPSNQGVRGYEPPRHPSLSWAYRATGTYIQPNTQTSISALSRGRWLGPDK